MGGGEKNGISELQVDKHKAIPVGKIGHQTSQLLQGVYKLNVFGNI